MRARQTQIRQDGRQLVVFFSPSHFSEHAFQEGETAFLLKKLFRHRVF